MPDRSIYDLESQGSFLTRVGPVGRAVSRSLSLVRRMPDAAGVELLPRGKQSDDATHCISGSSYEASGRINSLARRPSNRSGLCNQYDEALRLAWRIGTLRLSQVLRGTLKGPDHADITSPVCPIIASRPTANDNYSYIWA